jgi:hypothetical protein
VNLYLIILLNRIVINMQLLVDYPVITIDLAFSAEANVRIKKEIRCKILSIPPKDGGLINTSKKDVSGRMVFLDWLISIT